MGAKLPRFAEGSRAGIRQCMNQPIEPWSPYSLADSLPSRDRLTLTSAFGDLVELATEVYSYELYDIFNTPPDNGEDDVSRHLIELQAQVLSREFVHGRIETFARPLQGGDVEPLGMDKWEIDDPLPRFATGAFNAERWADPCALLTHRIFVDKAQFDRWPVARKAPGPLTDEEIEAVLDPQVRGARAIASRGEDLDQERLPASLTPAFRQPEFSSRLLTLREVEDLTTRKKSTIYELEKQGHFPRRLKLGASSRWYRHEVEAWLREQLDSQS